MVNGAGELLDAAVDVESLLMAVRDIARRRPSEENDPRGIQRGAQGLTFDAVAKSYAVASSFRRRI